MAATLQSLFPQIRPDMEGFNVFPCYAEFSAPVVAGKYVFDESTTPAVDFGKLLQGQVGIIAGVMITANCSSSEFTTAIDKPMKLQVLHGGNMTPVNMAPFPFTEFSQGDNFQLQWEITGATMQQEENFKLSVTGDIDQLSSMTQNELKIKITFNFIRVGSNKVRK